MRDFARKDLVVPNPIAEPTTIERFAESTRAPSGKQEWGFGLALLYLFCLVNVSLGYSIHDSCQGELKNNVKNAADEALEALAYAQFRGDWRMQHPLPAQYGDTLMQDMLGGDNADDWTNAISWFGVAASKVGPYSDTADGKVVIFCGSDHLASIDANTGMFRDQLNSYSPVKLRPGMTVACSGDYEAFGYQLAGGGFAIVLCGQSPHSALQASTEGLKMYRAWQFEGKPVDGAKILMTYKILHEFIHVADPINQFPNKLPDGTNEVYGYDKISEKDSSGQYVLSKENKRHNADSFAFVATAWYNRAHYVVSGTWIGLPISEYPPKGPQASRGLARRDRRQSLACTDNHGCTLA